tara:strand:+ start:385 stop:537 length:153 start_codon:yes stop_codon:yes gene_type:complete
MKNSKHFKQLPTHLKIEQLLPDLADSIKWFDAEKNGMSRAPRTIDPKFLV